MPFAQVDQYQPKLPSLLFVRERPTICKSRLCDNPPAHKSLSMPWIQKVDSQDTARTDVCRRLLRHYVERPQCRRWCNRNPLLSRAGVLRVRWIAVWHSHLVHERRTVCRRRYLRRVRLSWKLYLVVDLPLPRSADLPAETARRDHDRPFAANWLVF